MCAYMKLLKMTLKHRNFDFEFCIGNASITPSSWPRLHLPCACVLEDIKRTLFPSCMTNHTATPPPGQLSSLRYTGDIATQEGRAYLFSHTSRAPGLFPYPPSPGTRSAGGEGAPDLALLFQGRRQLPLPAQMKTFLSQVPQSLISGCVCG